MNRLRDWLMLLLLGVAFGLLMFYVLVASPSAAWGLK